MSSPRSDDDDEDTVEFSIELVSSSSSSSTVESLCDDGDAASDLAIVEIEQDESQVPQQEQQSLKLGAETNSDCEVVEEKKAEEDKRNLEEEAQICCACETPEQAAGEQSPNAEPLAEGTAERLADAPPGDAASGEPVQVVGPTESVVLEGEQESSTTATRIPEAPSGANELAAEEAAASQVELTCVGAATVSMQQAGEAQDEDGEVVDVEVEQHEVWPENNSPEVTSLGPELGAPEAARLRELAPAEQQIGEQADVEAQQLEAPQLGESVEQVVLAAEFPRELHEAVKVVAAAAELAGREGQQSSEVAQVSLTSGFEGSARPHVDILIEPAEKEHLQEATAAPPVEANLQRRRSSVASVLQVNMQLTEDEEDLEREFDEEPEFERRQVVVRRHCDVRSVYTLGPELGRGRFGTVFRCTELGSGRELAAKFVHTRRPEDREDVEREVAIMSVLQHKRLLQLVDAFDDGNTEMCLITELVEGGELFERIIDDDFELTEKKAAIFMRQICEGVEYMQSEQIVHLDMKPENILCLSKTCNRIKLIDFGLARKLEPKEPLRVMFGTPDFAAPEVLSYEEVSLATDMWSVGVICYVLLSGLSPFMGDSDLETMANVMRAEFDFEDRSFEPITELAKDFISKLLLRNPEKRLKPSECLQHAWLQRGGAKLAAAVRERRESIASLKLAEQISLNTQATNSDTINDIDDAAADKSNDNDFAASEASSPTGSGTGTFTMELSLNKRNLKKYVVRRKWHKTAHAIMALGRMGANLKLKLPVLASPTSSAPPTPPAPPQSTADTTTKTG